MKRTLPTQSLKGINLIFSFVLLTNISFAQNYQTVQSEQINYYGTGNLDYVLATRTDSIEVIGGDSTFYSYKTIRNDSLLNGSGMVGYHAGAPWYGKSVKIENNGTNTFTNRYNETISIETQAVLGETFEIYTYPNGVNTIFGTVTLQDTMTILGTLDSIKHITMFVSGASFIWNNQDLIISKNHGFMRIVPFYSFPFAYEKTHYEIQAGGNFINTPLTLIGSEFPRVGITKLTGYEMYSMDVSDAVGVYQSHTCSPIFNSGSVYTRRTVISRTDLGNNSTAFGFSNSINSTSSGCWSPGITSSLTVDGMDEYKDNYLPEELYEGPSQSNIDLLFQTISLSENCGQQLVSENYGFGFTWQPNDLVEIMAVEPYVVLNNYLEGFGPVHTAGNIFDGSNLTYVNISGYVYNYELGANTCGDLTIGITEDESIEFSLSPNPVANGTFSLASDLPNQKAKVSITNLMGQVVLEKNLDSFTDEVVVNHLPKGMFIVKYNVGSKLVIRKVEIL